MDPYQGSLQRVDDALSRLTATLALYKVDQPFPNVSPPPSPQLASSVAPPNLTVPPARSTNRGSGTGKKNRKAARAPWWEDPPPLFSRGVDLDNTEWYPKITNPELRHGLNRLRELSSFTKQYPYSIALYHQISRAYVSLGYPELAAGAAYRALLLIDEANDEEGEFHQDVVDTLILSVEREPLSSRVQMLREYSDLAERFDPTTAELDEQGYVSLRVEADEALVWAREWYSISVYLMLAQCLHICGCERSAITYCLKGLQLDPKDESLLNTRHAILRSCERHFHAKGRDFRKEKIPIEQFPDTGWARREMYPWNKHEPDRCSDATIATLNAQMQKVAPKLEVRATELPVLDPESKNYQGTIKQLGVFAKEDIAPGEVVLTETSVLAANNRLRDALCDACSTDLPDLTKANASPEERAASANMVTCPDCVVVFCSQKCLDLAEASYHPALCDRDVEAMAKDVPPAESAE
ncbi:hypothetical protein LTR66_010600, partial [Elasticomyces elasticus]